MTDNVIILGAGASVDAGIPVLSNFVEKMWEFAIKGKHDGKPLSDEDKKIFEEAIKVKNELDGYHGRAAFNDRNLEDILSILSFNLIGGDESDIEKLNWFTKAIARTIELTCNVKHSGKLNSVESEGADIYRIFWSSLFDIFSSSPESFPAFISFNYDLVLERSLLQAVIGTNYSNNKRFPFDGIKLNYHYNIIKDLVYKTKYTSFDVMKYDYPQIESGVVLEKGNAESLTKPINIEILKLHGSLNFPSENNQEFSLTKAASKPYIVPPVINKWVGKDEESIWSAGLQCLREAKNIVIVGYSLPQTDIYMQYFIKAGIGPNTNLNKIYVFNPVLCQSGDGNEQMKERFENCFSHELRNRINFQPFRDYAQRNGIRNREDNGIPNSGNFSDFVDMMRDGDLFFGML